MFHIPIYYRIFFTSVFCILSVHISQMMPSLCSIVSVYCNLCLKKIVLSVTQQGHNAQNAFLLPPHTVGGIWGTQLFFVIYVYGVKVAIAWYSLPSQWQPPMSCGMLDSRRFGEKVKSSMARSLPEENLLPQNVGSIINYLQ